MVMLHAAPTDALPASFKRELRALLDAAFSGGFDEDDWDHALGGVHVWLLDETTLISHASVVERTIVCSGEPLRTGFVEAVATAPEHRRQGHGGTVLRHINALIRERYVLGALSTGSHAFYERHGWERWRGPTFVVAAAGPERTPDDDDDVMILRTPRTPPLDLDGPIMSDWRKGDVW